MELNENVAIKIKEFESQLEFLEIELAREMQKDYKKRKALLLDFLYKEKTIYQFALTEFKKLLDVSAKTIS